MNIVEEFDELFKEYSKDRPYLSIRVTCLDRPKDPFGSPHKKPGNAMDFTLRTNRDYSPIKEYNDLMLYMIKNWPYRAGVDNTPADGNVHIHIDLGQGSKTGVPYFFIENNGKWVKEATTEDFA